MHRWSLHPRARTSLRPLYPRCRKSSLVRGRQLPGNSEELSTSTEAGWAGGAGGRTKARCLQCAGVELLSVPRLSSG